MVGLSRNSGSITLARILRSMIMLSIIVTMTLYHKHNSGPAHEQTSAAPAFDPSSPWHSYRLAN